MNSLNVALSTMETPGILYSNCCNYLCMMINCHMLFYV